MQRVRYMLMAVMAVMVSAEALAWSAEVNKAILMFAEENLKKGSRKEVVEILGAPLHSVKFEGEGRSQTRLNKQGASVTTDENDAVVRLEKAIAVLGKEGISTEERKSALLTAVELTVDIHCPANILIDEILEEDFTFMRGNGRPKSSKWYQSKSRSWQEMWHKLYHIDLGSFSAEMYLYDWRIATKGMAKSYKGAPVAPRKWAEHTGERVLYALKTFKPDADIDMLLITKHEYINDEAMYDAAFRLALLLNTVL